MNNKNEEENSGWKEVKLGEVLKINYGKDHKKLSDGKIPLYGSGGIMRYVEKSLFDEESILIPRKGTLSNLFYTNEPIWVVDTIFWTKINKEIVLPRFLFYQLKTKDFTLLNVGAAVPSLTTLVLNEVDIFLPPLPTQKRIASILSAYDDLIENNLKRIKLLEEVAQRTYEEWFVKFRINGEQLHLDEKTGLPEGWERKRLVEVAIIIMGQSPKSEFYNKENKGLPFHQGVSDYGFRFPTNSTWTTESSRFAEKGDILFSVRAPVGRLNVAIEKIALGRGLSAIRHKNNFTDTLLYQLQNIFFKDDMMGGGSIFNSVTKSDVERIIVIEAENKVMNMFNEFASNFNNQIENLTKQNQKLKESRDILLPKLMNGTLNIAS